MIDTPFQKLMAILDQLENARIWFSLNRVREDSIMIEVAVPGQRWEIEVLGDSSVEVEVFQSDGIIYDETKIGELMDRFADRLTPAPCVQETSGMAQGSLVGNTDQTALPSSVKNS
jgi:hypothetical protein